MIAGTSKGEPTILGATRSAGLPGHDVVHFRERAVTVSERASMGGQARQLECRTP